MNAKTQPFNTAALPLAGPGLMTPRSGRVLDLAAPDAGQIDIGDIAHGLSRQDHYQGHSSGDEIYSVAQHSLWLASYLCRATGDANTALHGLMCHASKAYIGTVSPVVETLLSSRKRSVDDLQATVQRAIYDALEMPALTVQQAHWVLIAKQQAQLIESLQRAPVSIPDCSDLIDSIAWDLSRCPLMASRTMDEQASQWQAALLLLRNGEMLHG